MIAGRLGHEGLCQLHTKQFCTQLTIIDKGCLHGQNVMQSLLLILLTISLPNIEKVAMSLYDIMHVHIYSRACTCSV